MSLPQIPTARERISTASGPIDGCSSSVTTAWAGPLRSRAFMDAPLSDFIRMCSQTYLPARGDAGTYPSRQRDCVATASLSAETQGDAIPLLPHPSPLHCVAGEQRVRPPLRDSSMTGRKSVLVQRQYQHAPKKSVPDC